MNWLLNFFDRHVARIASREIADKTAILHFLMKHRIDSSFFGLVSKLSPRLMHVSVENITLNDTNNDAIISFNWHEPTGEFLAVVTVKLNEIIAIYPFGDEGNSDGIFGCFAPYLDSPKHPAVSINS